MGTRLWHARGARVALAFVLGISGVAAVAPMASAAGPCDTPANPIVAENCLSGTAPSQWDVSGAGDASIQGFATQISVNRGDTVHFKVKTDAAAYGIDIYRLGYYGGNGARFIASVNPTATLPQTQPGCLNDPTTGLIDCGNWAESAAWGVPANATSGVYLAKLHRTDTAGASHIVFIVRNDASHSDLLFQTSDTTWQAYNNYGGNSLYTGEPAGRAFKVSYNRPFSTRDAPAEDFVFNAEFPMIRWLEANGYDTSYVASADVDRSGPMLQQHKVFMSVGHDEYWSLNQRANVEAARNAGVHLAFFSGNEIFWKTRWEASIDASSTDHRTLVSYKETHANDKIDPSPQWTGTWRDPLGASLATDGGRPENALSGTIFTVDCCTYPMQVPAEAGDLRFWRNTSVASATGTSTLPEGTLGYEWDEDLDNGSRPGGEIDLSSTTVNVPERILDQGSNYGPGTATHSLTLHRVGNALVFAAGTVQWSWGLDGTHDRGGSTPSTAMRQATVNLFADMGVQPGSLQAGLTAATASTDSDAPTATTDAPASETVPAGTAVTITGTAADTGGGRVGGVEVSTDGSTWHPASGRDAWSYTFTPDAAGALSIRSRATDDSLNTGAASAPVALTVSAAGCPCSLWNDSATPALPAPNNGSPIETGTRFTSDVDGTVTAVRFYKGEGNTGAHTGHLWSADGTLLGTATFNGETDSGWQQAALSTPIPITAQTQYIVSNFSVDGYYAFTGGYFTGSSHDNAPLHAPQDSEGAHNGVFSSGSSGFPTSSFNGSNYWVDVVVDTGPDTVAPVITARTPAPNASNVALGSTVRVQFDEALDPDTVTNGTVQLQDAGNALVPAAVTYDTGTRTATLTPNAPLTPSTGYTVTVHGGAGGVTDVAHNELVADVTWGFTSAPPPADEGPGGPILVVTSTTAPFGRYLSEILKAEGLNEYLVTDISHVTPGMLAGYGVVVLGEMPLSAAQATTFSDFVTAGGNLIAMHPDPDLAGLLGISSAGSTLSDGYLRVNTGTPPGRGITGQTIQFHGSADRYTLSGATAVATLFSNATTPTVNPAVTLRSVGASGGQAAAFTYDLARSVVETRQGNPDWAGQERDAITPIRSDDLFFGAKAEDPQADWVNLAKVQIPQADEQQRLLANMILNMEQDRAPLPRFWYLPHGESAAVVLTGDDHGSGGTAGRFDAEAALNPGCSVADWECVRSTSYVYEGTPLTDAEAAAYNAQGFEVALHVNTNCADWDPSSLEGFYASQLDVWHAKYTSLPGPVSNRTHCITWSDYDTQPQVELQHGIRFDTNYYYWPGSWIQDRPGLFTGSGFPQRFATAGGDTIDVYQAATQMTDESDQTYPSTINTLLDNAVGPLGYYGAFTANIHTDASIPTQWSAIVGAAQSRGVPLVSARQMLTWLDARNASSFGNVTFAGDVLGFTLTAAAGATGLQAMLPAKSASGATLTALTRNSASVPFTTVTRKGIDYIAFDGLSGTYSATYTSDTTPPVISALTATPATGGATIAWTTDEPADSKVMYGTSPAALTTVLTDNALVTAHSRTITGLTPGATYFYKVSSADAFDNVATAPPAAASFVVPAFVKTDTTAADFNAGTLGPCRVVTRSGDGELTLTPADGSDFNGASLPSGWTSAPWAAGGSATVGGGLLTADGSFTARTAFLTPGRSLEFVATFQATPFQHIGFADDLNNNALWAIFSTGSDGASLKARTNNGAAIEEVIPGNWLGTPHRFRIDWTASQVVYSIDGTVVTTHTAAMTASMRPAVSDLAVGGGALTVDWLDLSPYTSPCTFQSRTFDAGTTVDWTTLERVASVPAGSGLTIDTRSSANGTTWSAFAPVSGSTIASPDNRYLQYRATLTGTSTAPALASVTVTAASESVPPTTTMLLPASNALVRGNAVLLDASAADNVGVSRVEFRATGGELHDAVVATGGLTIYGWLAFWNTVGVADGTYTLQSVAYDAAGNAGRSAAITVKVDNTAPTTSVLVPSNGGSVRGTSVILDASATDAVGVTRVEFRATPNNALIGTGALTIYGWIYVWNSDLVAEGTYTLTSVAFDGAGNSTTSAPITIKVDRTPPTVAIIVPATNGTTVGASAVLDASATDAVGVTRVEFRATLNNALIGTGALTYYGWIFVWNTSAVPNGTYSINAVASDAAGNATTSAARTLVVSH